MMDAALRTLLCEKASEFGVELSGEQVDKFDKYGDLLLSWNEKMNLTAIRDPEGVVIRHFIDSLSLLSVVPLQREEKVIDVGTGAGFPGIPLLIARPNLQLTLLDSLNKRLVFLQEVLKELSLSAQTIHARAEEGGRQKALREQFDLATARAVAALPVLCEYCLPFVKQGGHFVAMKGPDGYEEAKAAQHALLCLQAKLCRQVELTLPDDSRRTLLVMEKIGHTPATYPRAGAKMAKNPL